MTAQRMVFMSVALTNVLGVWLTGFDKASWVLYVPIVLLSFAAVTGICPGLIFWRRLGLK